MNFLSFFLLFFFCFLVLFTKANDEELEVFIFPHSHNDPGWYCPFRRLFLEVYTSFWLIGIRLRTFDEYFEASWNGYAGVRQIISSYLEALSLQSDRKYNQVEMSFYEKFLDQASDEDKEKLEKLVANGQLSFLGGGYVMNDEACSFWEDIIDQMTLGHQILLSLYNYVPEVACTRLKTVE